MKIVKCISLLVVFLTILCAYSWSIYHTSTGGNKLGALGKSLIKFASFPQFVEEVLSSPEVNNMPETYLAIDTSFRPINNLNYDLFGLTSFWSNATNIWEVKLINLRDDKELYSWTYTNKTYKDNEYQFSNARLVHTILLPYKKIIVKPDQTANLTCLDSNSNIIWTNTNYRFHHSMNFDAEGYVWVCASDIELEHIDCYPGGLVKNLDGKLIAYREDYMAKLDPRNGKVIWKKGVAQSFLDNDLNSYLYGGNLFDPIHLNDIQPVLEEGPYWKKNDLFLSIRNRSVIIQYRPSTNKIIKIIKGSFINQHDVYIVSDHEIMLFNNNMIVDFGYNCTKPNTFIDSLNTSEVIIFDFKTDSFKTIENELFVSEKISSQFEGRAELLADGSLFVEEVDQGRYYIVNDGEIVYRKTIPTKDSNYVNMPNWIRLYEDNPLESK